MRVEHTNLETGHFPGEALSIPEVLVFPAAEPEGGAHTQGIQSQPLLRVETKELVLHRRVGLALISVYLIDHEGPDVIENIESEGNVSPLILLDWSVLQGLECEAVTSSDGPYSQGRSVTEDSHELGRGGGGTTVIS